MTESTIQVSHNKDVLTVGWDSIPKWDRADNVWDVDVSHVRNLIETDSVINAPVPVFESIISCFPLKF